MSRAATPQQTWLKQQKEAQQNQQGTWDIPKGIKLLLAETSTVIHKHYMVTMDDTNNGFVLAA